MKIENIKKVENTSYLFEVSLQPNWIEKLFGYKPKTEKYIATGNQFMFGGGNIYVNEKGEMMGNGCRIGEAIDKYRRKEKIKTLK